MHLFVYLGIEYENRDQKGIEHKPSNAVTEPSKLADINKLPRATQQAGRHLGYTIEAGYVAIRQRILPKHPHTSSKCRIGGDKPILSPGERMLRSTRTR
jgi:hypothetical protein